MASSSPYSGKWEYDVFVCFRGGDTRRGFTSHLTAALSNKHIRAFIDTMLEKTECIAELLCMLKRSALSVVIFSENFADSPWCLDEVATIARSMEEFGHRVLPVFYDVDPSDVAEDSGSYADTIDKLDATGDCKKRWKDALKAVADRAGLTSLETKNDSELINAAVEDVTRKLIGMSQSLEQNNLIGMDSRVSNVEQLLAMNTSDDVFIIGLWGMGGMGKTTLARTCYQRVMKLSITETKHCFIQDVSDGFRKQHGIDGLVRELYSTLLSEDELSCEALKVGYRRERLSRSRVFIVLDDVETPSQLELLLLGDVQNPTRLFAPGSRIVVTTRNRKVLEYAMAKIYPVCSLGYDESLQLFCIHAFRQALLPNEWKDLSNLAVSYCKGSPLALKVLGGTLFSKNRDYWESLLGELRKVTKPGINAVLRRSYDALGAEGKRLFLDVACFLYGRTRSSLIKYLVHNYSCSYSRVEDLIDNSLFLCILAKHGEIIEVHDLLKEMAWNIVNEEPKLEKRSRLQSPNDIHRLLTICKGDKATEAITLNLSQANKEMHLKANFLEVMHSLRWLQFYWPKGNGACKIHLVDGTLDSLPDGLLHFHWDGFPAKALPVTFCPETLVQVIIRHSPIEKCWQEGFQPNLVNLIVLDLSYCENLTTVPDISESSNLEHLLLNGCKTLVELPLWVQFLDNLVGLDLGGCQNLQFLPPKLNSKVLMYFKLYECPKALHCPDITSAELSILDLEGTPVTPPNATCKVKHGGILRLFGQGVVDHSHVTGYSTSLALFRLSHTAIRDINHNLPRSHRLELIGNSQLKTLPGSIWETVRGELVIESCPLLEGLPEISEHLETSSFIVLRAFLCRSIKSVPSGICHLKSLQVMCFSCAAIKSLPSCIQELDQLFQLDLSYCELLESIPHTIKKLAKLSLMFLSDCHMIKSLPELPPSLNVLITDNCYRLEDLSSNIGKLRWQHLKFANCHGSGRNLLDQIGNNFLRQAILSPRIQVVLSYPGSQLPEWYCYKSEKDCVMLQLPDANSNNKQLKGIAFGVVYSSYSGFLQMHIKCECCIKSVGESSSSSSSIPISGWSSLLSISQLIHTPGHVYLWFDNKLGRTTKEGDAWYVKYAGFTVSFRFYAEPADRDGQSVIKFKIKRSGVFLRY